MENEVVYKPEPIARAFLTSEKFFNFCVGPIGSAKTTAMLFKILYHAKRQAPHPRDGIRRTKWAIIRGTRQQLKDTTLASFFKWFVPGIAGRWIASDDRFIFEFDDVYAEILFRPLDRPEDIERVLSLEITGAAIDEFVQINKDIVESLSGRCGRYPLEPNYGPTWSGMFGVSNPGNEDNWWYDWLYADWEPNAQYADGGKEFKLGYFEQPSGFSPNAENVNNLEKIRPNYYQELAIGKTPEWVKQFIECEWGYSVRGQPIYPVFKRDLHVAPNPLMYNPQLPLIMGFDAGLTPAAVFMQVDPFGRLLVLDELTSFGMGAKRFCREKVKPMLRRRFPECELYVAADPAVLQRAQTDERAVADVLSKELGVRVHPARTNSLPDRIGAVEEALSTLTEVGPSFVIDARCTMLIRGFVSGYKYPTNAKGKTDYKPDKNEYSHIHDACQYAAMAAQSNSQRDARRRQNEGRPQIAFKNTYSMV